MIGTRRLILRPWRRSDVASLYAMGQDAGSCATSARPTAWRTAAG